MDTITTQGMAEEALPNQYIIELPLNAATSNISDFEQRQPDKTVRNSRFLNFFRFYTWEEVVTTMKWLY